MKKKYQKKSPTVSGRTFFQLKIDNLIASRLTILPSLLGEGSGVWSLFIYHYLFNNLVLAVFKDHSVNSVRNRSQVDHFGQ